MKRIAIIVMLALVSTACANAKEPLTSAATTASTPDLPQGSETVDLDPADFTTEIDNPYWPMTPGSSGPIAKPTPKARSRRSS